MGLLQGRHASTAELTASAYQAVILDQKYDGEPVQVRVPMGKEPMHLMAIFKGKMVIYEVGICKYLHIYEVGICHYYGDTVGFTSC